MTAESLPEKRPVGEWDGVQIGPGERSDVFLDVGESYSGSTVRIPLHVIRGPEEGPVVFLTAAVHGDELNGTGAIRALLRDESLVLRRGALICVPVLNIPGFERHSRYLPDRRDLNRCFPGLKKGSLASRLARIVFDEVVRRADYGIDLHTAAVRRTNFPNVRADLSDPEVRAVAEAFGSEFIIDNVGPKGGLRREACRAGCPTILLEGGEVWKVEPAIVASALRGIRNVLAHLGLIEGVPTAPPFRAVLKKTKWIRANRGGFLRFHAAPGDIALNGEPIATNTSLLGQEEEVMTAPFDAAVLGMTTLPAVSPGEPVYHLGRLGKAARGLKRTLKKLPDDHPHEEVMDDLSSSMLVVDRTDPPD